MPIFDPAQSAAGGPGLASFHQPMEKKMTLDTIMVVIAVTAMFATLAFVLGWADKQTKKG